MIKQTITTRFHSFTEIYLGFELIAHKSEGDTAPRPWRCKINGYVITNARNVERAFKSAPSALIAGRLEVDANLPSRRHHGATD